MAKQQSYCYICAANPALTKIAIQKP